MLKEMIVCSEAERGKGKAGEEGHRINLVVSKAQRIISNQPSLNGGRAILGPIMYQAFKLLVTEESTI